MRIAQVSSLWEPVPPRTYGGVELVVHLLTEGLVRHGHEVVLFATADSTTQARLEGACPRGFRELGWDHRLERNFANVISTEMRMLGQVFAQADRFDVIHNHLGGTALPFANLVDTPVVTTLHNPLEPETVRALYGDYSHLPFISISDYQRTRWPELSYLATIYHGIDLDRFHPRFDVDRDGYLAFLGRMSPNKGAHLAIEIAHAVGRPLVLAGKIDDIDREYVESLQPHIDGQRVRYIGEVNHEQKVELLRNATATLFPIQWAEPFGLVLIESMACGTPVLAIRNGSIPEIVAPGITGFIGESSSELIAAFDRIGEIDRRGCRREVEHRFSAERMVSDHERLYQALAEARGTTNGRAAADGRATSNGQRAANGQVAAKGWAAEDTWTAAAERQDQSSPPLPPRLQVPLDSPHHSDSFAPPA